MASRATAAHVWLPRFAWFAVFYNVLVVVWGALVRASGSGAGCGDHWPLCNGQVVPVSPGFHTIIEFTHRMMTGGSTFIVLGLVIWIFRATAPRSTPRFFVVTSALLLINEAFLGALLVKLGYVTTNRSPGRILLLSVHLSNTLLLLAALTLTAWAAGRERHDSAQDWHDLHKATGFGWAMFGLLATIAVGVSGSMAALGDTLFPASSLATSFAQDFDSASPVLLRLRILHPVSALIAALFVIWLIARTRSSTSTSAQLEPAMRTQIARSTTLANAVIGLLLLQFALGIADILLLAPAWMQLLHLLGADLYWVSLVLLAAETVWPKASFTAQSTSLGSPASATAH